MEKASRLMQEYGSFIRKYSQLACILVGLSASLLFSGCRQTTTEKNSLIKLYGNRSVSNFSKNYFLYATRCHFGQPGALMASSGDMLLIENWLLVYDGSIISADGAIHFVDADSLLLVNGKVAGIKIDSGLAVSKLINLQNKEAIRQLKVLSITHQGYAASQPELEKIAAANPGCFLAISGNFAEDELEWLFKQFNPSTLMIELAEHQQHLLSGEQQLQTLYLSNNDSVYQCKPIPHLPNLRDFYFTFDGNSIAQAGDGKNWLKNNPQIKNLILTDWEEGYPKGLLSVLEAPQILIMGGMDIPAAEILAHRATLKRVIVDSTELQLELPGVKELVVFNNDDPQTLINNIGKKKTDCETLDVFATDQKINISPLLSLNSLEALTLIDADSIPLDPVKQMKKLKLLSYSTDSTNMDSTITELQAALPNTVVVANDGLCLGSGWLLLLVPGLIATGILAALRNKKPVT